MSDDFYLDAPAFAGFAKDLRGTGSTFTSAQERLSDTLARYTGCWGDDEIGKAFESNYWENSEKVRVGAGQAGHGIVGTADNAERSGEVLSGVDTETAGRIDAQTTTD